MNIKQFLSKLEKLNFSLSVDGEKLNLNANKDKVTQEQINAIKNDKEIINYIKTNKDELIKYLSQLPKLPSALNPKDIASIYRLSGLQEGMLFHSLYDDGSGSYFEQFTCDLIGPNIATLTASWAEVIKRHSILRTGFYYESFSIPIQCVYHHADLPVVELDYREMSGSAQQEAVTQYLEADREKGFDLASPPLMRLALFRLTDDRYTMLWSSHHILFDGWSMPILMGEVLNIYEQLSNGQSPDQPAEDKYEDFIRYLERRDNWAEEQYWKNHLQGISEGVSLPFIKRSDRGHVATKFRSVADVLDKHRSKLVQEYAKRNHITLNTLMQGVWALLLNRYTNNADVLFGAVVSGRPEELPNVEQRVGLYINTIVFRASFNEDEKITDWLQNLQTDQVASRKYQHTTLQDIKEWTGIKNDLFDSLLVFENYPINKLVNSKEWALKFENVKIHEQTNYPLTILIADTDGLNVTFSYDPELLGSTRVRSILDQFVFVLSQIIDGSADTLNDISAITPTEEAALSSFNETDVAYPKGETLISLFQAQAALTPTATALIFEGEELSYAELNKRSNQLAHYLQSQGITRETLVPLFLERSFEMLIGILGILKAGGAYVPIDPKYPQDRIDYMLSDTAAKLVLSSSAVSAKLARSGVKVIDLDTNWSAISGQDSSNPTTEIIPEQLAYVIYTSGSTGRPKGVMNEHGGVVNRLMWTQDYFQLTDEDVVLQKTTYSFDVSVWELLWPLLYGAKMVLARPGAQGDSDYLKAIIEEQHVTLMHFVPSMLNVFLLDLEQNNDISLKNVLCSGEALTAAQVNLFREKLPNVALHNLYGPTEAAIDVTYWTDVDKDQPIEIVPIGRPVSNTQIYILGANLQPAPIGVPGELCIGGIQVARGYLNLPELTAERFVKDPFSADANARLYRTGDSARWLADGNIEYLGRRDDQVKIRGYRIELGEIESILSTHPEVKQTVVLARKDEQGQTRLVAYVVTDNYDRAELESYLQERLPEYMVPRLWVQMERIPVTANGKTDKRALPAPDLSGQLQESYVAPRNATEEQLATIWQELLGLPQIGVYDNFFELGGHSLLAMRVISRVRQELGLELKIRDVFAYPRIAELAAQLAGSVTTATTTITRQERPEHIPLSYGQERLWFIDRLEGSVQYHVPALLRLTGEPDVKALETAFRTIVNRHEVLRTVIAEHEGQGYQKIQAKDNWTLKQTKLDTTDGTTFNNYIQAAVQQPFDLSADPMLRAELIQLTQGNYALLVTMHHIAADGWSIPLLVKELTTLYAAHTNNNVPELPELAIQYADHAIWQRNYLQGEVLADKLSYWEEQLSDVAVLQLPTDHGRPAVQGTAGARYNFTISKELSGQLQALSLEQGATLYMTLLAVFKLLLSRYSGQEDICVGTPVANRDREEVAELIGFFVNTLALRSQVKANEPFTTLLEQVKQTTLAAYEHQDVPFEKVVETVVKERDLSRSPLFQVMFALQNMAAVPELVLGDLQISGERIEDLTAKYDLGLDLQETAEGIQVNVEYATDLYEEATIARLGEHYLNLLAAVIQAPNKATGELMMLSRTEQEQLARFSTPAATPIAAGTITTLFEAQVKRTPKTTALVFGNATLSYRELNERSNRLARYLQKQGVGKETLVPVLLERGFELVTALLGIMKAGGAYVPVDPDYPQERIDHMLNDTNAALIVSDSAVSGKLLNKNELSVINLDTDKTIIDKEDSSDLTTIISPEQLAYVIYTSGSTGRPKGVMIEHRSIANYSQGFAGYLKMTADDMILQQSSISFDTLCEELYPALMTGAKIIIVKEGGKDIAALKHFIEEEGVTLLTTTPSVLEHLNRELKLTPNLRWVISGGEVLRPGAIDRIYPKVSILNTYGPSEGTVCATYFDIPELSQASLIGKPVNNTYIHILGPGDSPSPIGVPGELCIGGIQVARGYLNLPELTGERFIKDPFSKDKDARLYRTGDSARWLADGNIEYLGRKDDQVKIRGYRIELGEIESILSDHPQVKQAVVLARKDEQGQTRLVAYVVADNYDRSVLETYLQEQLPEYMVPHLWVPLEHIPVTTNGKTDKRALPAPDLSGQLQESYVAPRNTTEEQLAAIWQELLGLPQVGIYDNFFELGGHSLLAMRVISRVRQDMGLELKIKDLFAYPRIASLAEQLASSIVIEDTSIIGKQERPEHIPLSYGQERLWFIDQLEGSEQYHMPGVLALEGALNVDALEKAIGEVVDRHEVLRTVIREDKGQTYQYIKPKGNWKLDRENAGHLASNELALRAYISELVARPFDLSEDDMLRADLVHLSDDMHLLVLTAHHIATDAWSMPILVNEIATAYVAYNKGDKLSLPEPALQFADYALWQRNDIQEEKTKEQLKYWEQKLSEVAVLQLPMDSPRQNVGSINGATAVFNVGEELSVQLKKLSEDLGVTLYMTLLAVFNILLYRYSGQDDICVGTSIAGRPRPGLEGLIGFLVNTLALRNHVKSDETFTELLSQIKQTTLDAYEYQEVPFEKVVEAVVKERTPGISPLFQTMLVLANTPNLPETPVSDLKISNYDYDSSAVKFDLTFFVSESAEGLQCAVQYNAEIYSAVRIEAMTAHFCTLLGSAVAEPGTKVGQLKMLDLLQEEQLLAYGHSQSVYPQEKTVADLFEATVLKFAETNALTFEGTSISFDELNNRSNKLANALQLNGIKTGTLVPLYAERGIEMIVGILGILKAGAAYVPIDTDLPADRVNYILEDTAARIGVSTAKYADHLSDISNLAKVIELDEQNWELAAALDTNPERSISPDDLAYVIYTSGSTGKPKGVRITHRNLVDYVYGLDERISISKCKTFALVSTIATDLGNTVIYPSLLFGGTLHVFSKETVSHIEDLHAYFSNNRIDCVKIVPSHWKALSADEPLVPAQMLIFGGESLSNESVAKIRQYSDCKIINHYGPTETTIGKLLHEVTEVGTGIIPIGRPFSNTVTYVLNKDLQLCPKGVPGQLFIGGMGVAQGYVNEEKLTLQKFIADPIDAQGAVVYQTGDSVRYNADGNIEYLGRIDDQVKIRGYRVEPGEISRIMEESDLVSQAVVLSRSDKQGNNQLVGYVVADGQFDRAGIVAYLKELLPDYMLPTYINEVDSIPLTASGKIDRKALPDPDTDATSRDSQVPANETELRLAEIWQDILELDTIGVEDDFFELGGHSLLAVRLISAIRKAFMVELPISDVFDHPSVRKLAMRLGVSEQNEEVPSIEIQVRPQHIPLSFSQERMWFIDRMEGSVQYHIPAVLHLNGALNVAVLEQAFRLIVDRHESLRTVIRDHQGQSYQYILPANGWVLTQTPIRAIRAANVSLPEFLRQKIAQPFDLSKDHMLRAELIETGSDAYVLLATMHHIASDGWSTSILVKELVELYNSLTEGRTTNQLTTSPLQYADYAIWQRNYLQGDVLDAKLSYWKEKLNGVAPLQLPTDYSRPLIRSNRGATIALHIDKEIQDQLYALSRKQGATIYMTLLSAFIVLLHRYSGQGDISVGTPISGRNYQEIEDLIGFFINTLVLRNQVHGGESFVKLLEQVKSTTLEAYNHQEVPFEKVVEAVVKERDLSRSPLFQVMFILQNTPDIPELKLGDVTLTSESAEDATAKFDISLNLLETEDGLRGGLEYNTDLFKAATMELMISHFTVLLRSIIDAPDQNLGYLNILTPAEEFEQIKTFNSTAVSYPKDKSIADMFAQQVIKTPDSIAVEFEDEVLTYKQLSERSANLARYLNGNGVGAETLVPICIERGINMIVSIMAVLKAGGAYVPLDPEIPQERIEHMLNDTGASIVLSNGQNSHKFNDRDILVVDPDNYNDDTEDQKGGYTAPVVKSTQLAYIIYTSGSTGKPKGVMVEHKGVVNLALLHKPALHLKQGTRVLQFASFGFDASCVEIFSTLLSGGCLVMCAKESLLSPHEFEQLLVNRKVEVAILPPSFQQLIENIPSTLKVIISAGEALNESIGKRLQAQGVRLFNGYGPTEGTVCATMTDEPIWPGGTITIGKPIANVQVYILNTEGQLNPIGVTGEICIGGTQVARGYLNRPQLTDEKFINDPFTEISGARIYRTGDLGRWLADGSVEYLGRMDDQVKIRGYRIELGEIESVLSQSELVTQAVVLCKPDQNGSNRLIGYFTTEGDNDKHALMTYLSTRLPEYMVPSLWVKMDQFALTSSGKIDKNALPDIDVSEQVSEEYVAPRNEFETRLQAMWQEVLGVDKISIHSNFFELGGHSILAMRLIAMVKRELNVQITIRDLFINPTIAKVYQRSQIQNQDTYQSLIPIKSTGNKIPLYIISGAGGTAFKFKEFVKLLDREQPVYGLQQPLHIKSSDEFPETIEEIAKNYIEEMLMENPNGPYALAGHCLGGMIAIEIADQLRAMGKKVSLLAMFDADSKPLIEELPASQSGYARFTSLLKRSLSSIVVKLKFETFLLMKHPKQAIMYKARKIGPLFSNSESKLANVDQKVFDEVTQKIKKASDDYNIKYYDDDIVLFNATQQYYFIDKINKVIYKELEIDHESKYAWGNYAKAIKVHDVSGEHSTIFDTVNATAFSNLLQRYLDEGANDVRK